MPWSDGDAITSTNLNNKMGSTYYNVKDETYGAVGDNSTDDTSAIQAAIDAAEAAGGGIVVIPATSSGYKITSPLTITDGVRIAGVGPNQRWRASSSPVVLNYSGTTACILFQPAASIGIDSVEISGLIIDGQGATGNVDGMFFDGSASGGYNEGLLVENCTVRNFPRYQLHILATSFDITFKRVTFHDDDSASGDHLVYVDNTGGTPAELTFDDCWFANNSSGKWAFYGSITSVRFIGGTVTPRHVGAHGILANGGLFLYGTHLEPIGSSTGTGIRYYNSGGAFISPATCASFDTGVEIGNPDVKATAARGWVLAGCIGNNTTQDVLINDGGNRKGTIVTLGYANGNPTITDNRYDTDGTLEVLNLNDISNPLLINSLTHVTTANYAAIGTTPATTGHIRWPSVGSMYFRNSDNTGNILALYTPATNNVQVGSAGVGEVQLTVGSDAVRMVSGGHLRPHADSTQDLGISAAAWRTTYSDTFLSTSSTPLSFTTAADANDMNNHDLRLVFTSSGLSLCYSSGATLYDIQSNTSAVQPTT